MTRAEALAYLAEYYFSERECEDARQTVDPAGYLQARAVATMRGWGGPGLPKVMTMAGAKIQIWAPQQSILDEPEFDLKVKEVAYQALRGERQGVLL